MSQSEVARSSLQDNGQLSDIQAIEDAIMMAKNKRLDRVHLMETRAVSSLLWPIPEGLREFLHPQAGPRPRVLSVNSGSGIWAVEMARTFPNADVLGIDRHGNLNEPSDLPSNCRFTEFDMVGDDISKLGKFDVVHCARGGGWIRSHKPFWERLAKLVKPGGFLLYVTGGMGVYNSKGQPIQPAKEDQESETGSWWARFGEVLEHYAPLSEDASTIEPNESFRSWLRSVGSRYFEDKDIKDDPFHVDILIGPPSQDEDNLPGAQIEHLVGRNAIDWADSLEFSLKNSKKPMPDGLLESLMKGLRADIWEQRVKAYGRWHFFALQARAQ